MSCSFFDSPEPELRYTQIDCKLYDETFKLIAQFPGFYCDFAPNGEWLGLEDDRLILYNKDNSPKYKFPDSVHHELKFSSDGKKIYFLSSEVKIYKNRKTRFDVMNVSDRNGKLLYRWSTYDHIADIIKTLDLNDYEHVFPTPLLGSARHPVDTNFEFSHINAIAEIPENTLESDLPFMKRGNLLVTFNGLGGLVIFDPELKNILHVFNKMLKIELYGFHDAQIWPNGHLTLFQNVSDKDGEFGTSLKEFDIKSEKEVWSFLFRKPAFTYNPINGSLQVLPNDNLFIGENSFGGRALELTRNGEFISLIENSPRDPLTRFPYMIYRAKKVNVDMFLKNNQLGIWARNQN